MLKIIHFYLQIDAALVEGIHALKQVLSKGFSESSKCFNTEQKYKHIRLQTLPTWYHASRFFRSCCCCVFLLSFCWLLKNLFSSMIILIRQHKYHPPPPDRIMHFKKCCWYSWIILCLQIYLEKNWQLSLLFKLSCYFCSMEITRTKETIKPSCPVL